MSGFIKISGNTITNSLNGAGVPPTMVVGQSTLKLGDYGVKDDTYTLQVSNIAASSVVITTVSTQAASGLNMRTV